MRAARLGVVAVLMGFLLGVSAGGLGCSRQVIPADPEAVTWPVYDPIANGRTVAIHVVKVNGQDAPGDSLAEAIDAFREYVAGEVVVSSVQAASTGTDDRAVLSETQLEHLVEQANVSWNSTIVLVLAPALAFSPDAGLAQDPIAGSATGMPRVIVIHADSIDRSVEVLPLSREGVWKAVIAHELMHTLRVPSDRSHQWNDRHCTQKDCLLHRGIDRRSAFQAGLGWGHLGQCDLCDRCRSEVRAAQAGWSGKLIPPDAPFDHVGYAERVVALNPDRARAYMLRAVAYLGQDQFPAAVDDLTRAIELDPDRAEAYRDRATAWRLMGDCRRAIEDGSRAVELAPDDAYTLNNLAWLFSTSCDADCRDGKRAVELARRACELTGRRDPTMLDTLATAYAEAGDFEAAVRCIDEALALAEGELREELLERQNLLASGVLYRE